MAVDLFLRNRKRGKKAGIDQTVPLAYLSDKPNREAIELRELAAGSLLKSQQPRLWRSRRLAGLEARS